MKTYLPQIERRIIVRPNYAWGILNFDIDNAYPQRMLELIGQSPTAKACWDKRIKYIGGNGFVDEKLAATPINRKGLTLAKLLHATATDKGLFTGFGWHFNYNANYRIAEVNFVKFEDIREPDDSSDKYAVYPDWGRKTWKSITTSRIQYIDKYNPDPDVIRQQVIDAGGWDEYKGQLYYFNPQVDDYPLIVADEVWEDFETEAGIKIFNNRQITNGFMPSVVISQRQRREEADNANPMDDEDNRNRPTQLERDLGLFQGVKNGQNILFLEHTSDEDKPEITTFQMQNNDKLFELTEKSVAGRIIKGFMVPKELIDAEKSSGLSNGGEKKEAIREFNDNTAPERKEISAVFADIFANFYRPIQSDWEIAEIPGNVADDLVSKIAGANINQLLVMGIPKARKIAILVNAYQFKEAEAEAMVPEDDEIKHVELIDPPKPITE
jgi:hypothetical protein